MKKLHTAVICEQKPGDCDPQALTLRVPPKSQGRSETRVGDLTLHQS